MTAFIYIMRRPDGLRKVGYTSDLKRRMGEHQWRLGRGCELEMSACVPQHFAARYESRVHHLLNGGGSRVEIFRCSREEARVALLSAISEPIVERSPDHGSLPSSSEQLNALLPVFGSQAALADAIGIDKRNITEWRRRGYGVPTKHHEKIYAAAKMLGKESDLPWWMPTYPAIDDAFEAGELS